MTYVYESGAYWDKEKQRSRSKRRLIGMLYLEIGEVILTLNYERKQVDGQPSPSDKSAEQSITTRDVGDVLRRNKRHHYVANYSVQEIAKEKQVYKGLK